MAKIKYKALYLKGLAFTKIKNSFNISDIFRGKKQY